MVDLQAVPQLGGGSPSGLKATRALYNSEILPTSLGAPIYIPRILETIKPCTEYQLSKKAWGCIPAVETKTENRYDFTNFSIIDILLFFLSYGERERDEDGGEKQNTNPISINN